MPRTPPRPPITRPRPPHHTIRPVRSLDVVHEAHDAPEADAEWSSNPKYMYGAKPASSFQASPANCLSEGVGVLQGILAVHGNVPSMELADFMNRELGWAFPWSTAELSCTVVASEILRSRAGGNNGGG